MLDQQKMLELEARMGTADENPPSLNALLAAIELLTPLMSRKVEIWRFCKAGNHKVKEGESFDSGDVMFIGIDGKSHATVFVKNGRFEVDEHHGPEDLLFKTKSTARAAWRCCGYQNAPSVVLNQRANAISRAKWVGVDIGPDGAVPLNFYISPLTLIRWRLERRFPWISQLFGACRPRSEREWL